VCRGDDSVGLPTTDCDWSHSLPTTHYRPDSRSGESGTTSSTDTCSFASPTVLRIAR
jgi:hypothetical protein